MSVSDDSKNEIKLMEKLQSVAPIILVMMEEGEKLDKYMDQAQTHQKHQFFEQYNQIDRIMDEDFNESVRGESLKSLFKDLTKNRKNSKKLFNKHIFHKSKVLNYQEELKGNRFSYEGLSTLFNDKNIVMLLDIQKGYFDNLEKNKMTFENASQNDESAKPKRKMPEGAKKPSLINKLQIIAPTILKNITKDSEFSLFMNKWFAANPQHQVSIINFNKALNKFSKDINPEDKGIVDLLHALSDNKDEDLKKILYREPLYRQFSVIGKRFNENIKALLALHNDYTNSLVKKQKIETSLQQGKPTHDDPSISHNPLLNYKEFLIDVKGELSKQTPLKSYSEKIGRTLGVEVSKKHARYRSEVKAIFGLLNKSGLSEVEKVGLVRQYFEEMRKELSQEAKTKKSNGPFVLYTVATERISEIDNQFKNTSLPTIEGIRSTKDMLHAIKLKASEPESETKISIQK